MKGRYFLVISSGARRETNGVERRSRAQLRNLLKNAVIGVDFSQASAIKHIRSISLQRFLHALRLVEMTKRTFGMVFGRQNAIIR